MRHATSPAPLNLWPHLAGRAIPEESRAAALQASRRLAAFLPPHLIAHLLPDIAPQIEATKARLMSRYLRGAYRDVLQALAEAGIPTVAFKGYANAFTLYPDPDLRIAGDLDIVVPRDRIAQAVRLLAERDLHPAEMDTGPWGFIGEESFLPIVGRDGLINIDLHTQADEYPLPLVLPAKTLLRTAVWNQDAVTRLPGREDTVLLLVSHAARDRFGPEAVKKVLDLIRLLPSGPAPADWDAVWDRAKPARLRKPLATTLALLAVLDIHLGMLPDALQRAVARKQRNRRLQDVAQNWRALAPMDNPGPFGKFADELLLAAEPRVLLYRQSRRLIGLMRPKSGRPPAV